MWDAFLCVLWGSLRSLRLRAFDRKDRKDNSEVGEKGKTLIRRDRQSSEHWRSRTGTAYNPPATLFFLTKRESLCQSEPPFTRELFRFAKA
jgi:hypothetical protein